jgi:hypothetical protein
MQDRLKTDRRGNALVEFALVSLVIIPLMLYTLSLGFAMGSNLQAIQISRDIAHMYAKGVDFSAAQSQSVAINLAQGYDLTSTGTSVIVLSQIMQVYQADCAASGYTPGQCSNLGQRVFVNRINIGKVSLRPSDFGTPNASYINPQGNIAASNYLTQAGAVATGFSGLLAQNQGEVAYVAEVFLPVPNFHFAGGSGGAPGVFSRAIF